MAAHGQGAAKIRSNAGQDFNVVSAVQQYPRQPAAHVTGAAGKKDLPGIECHCCAFRILYGKSGRMDVKKHSGRKPLSGEKETSTLMTLIRQIYTDCLSKLSAEDAISVYLC